jgi:hypothetical protein
MRSALENEPLGAVPSLKQIELEIGSFSAKIRKVIKENKPKRRRRRI